MKARDIMQIRSSKATTSRICPDSMNISRCDRRDIVRELGRRFPPHDSQGLRYGGTNDFGGNCRRGGPVSFFVFGAMPLLAYGKLHYPA
jgi:hypothetical protein